MLIVTSLLVAMFGAYIKYDVLRPLGLYQDKSIMELPFLIVTDDVLIYMMEHTQITEPTEPMEPTEPPVETQATEPPPETTVPKETEPIPTEPIMVEESWFDDALFIGNSLGVGLRDYASLGDADYFCLIGMNLFNTWENWVYVDGYGTVQLKNLLASNQYGKIYIHMGTNECGYDPQMVLDAYQELIDHIREYQPDTPIVVHGTITFGRYKQKQYRYMVPETITVLNEHLATLAEQENIYFIDFNPEIVDEEGYLPYSWSQDGCHPTAEGYRQWAQWIWDTAGSLGLPVKNEN